MCLKLFKISVNPRVINTPNKQPAAGWYSTYRKARVTVRVNIVQLRWAGEETILARVGEGIVNIHWFC